MPNIGYPYSLLQGMSSFWTKFFADFDQLDAMYQGTAILIGQAYLDLLTNVISVSLRDTPVFNKEYYRLILAREDEMRFVKGANGTIDRWSFALPTDLVQFLSLDNRVLEPTASLQQRNDYDLEDGQALFKSDPTDPPLNGFGRRQVEVSTGGSFADTALIHPAKWSDRSILKGDTLRLLDVSGTAQRKRQDVTISLVRDAALYAALETPLTATLPNFAILRKPSNAVVEFELFTPSFQLSHTRIDQGSVKIYSKRMDGTDVLEGVDYTVDYEQGKIYPLTTWQAASNNTASYTWRQQIFPTGGGSPPSFSTTGVVTTGPVTARVLQLAMWAPDALVDRHVLANNFGSLIGYTQDSSESYRAFLLGIFQLYVLGPVLERVESALNVFVGLPVVRDDGEIFIAIDTSDPLANRITTTSPITGNVLTYTFPKDAPLRTDLVAGQVLAAFDTLTTSITVTDYVETPQWWYGSVIPANLFGANTPPVNRRTASQEFVHHIVGATDNPQVGDPGLIVGADENGFIQQSGAVDSLTYNHPIHRHRMAFVLMDRYLKYHTFTVRFDPSVFLENVGSRFARLFSDFSNLIFSAKPSHTYLFVEPVTTFLDTVIVVDEGLLLALGIGSGVGTAGPDKVQFADGPLVVGLDGWETGDYFHYEDSTQTISFPTPSSPVSITPVGASPRRCRLVLIHVGTTIGGRSLVENIDYTVDYASLTVTRLTAWDATSSISVKTTQLNILNISAGSPDPTVGDTSIMVGGIDPATVHATYDPTVRDWSGNLVVQDLSLVDRALVISVKPA